MEALLNRYRNLTVLLIVIVAQLVGLAYQVKTNSDERLIRVWAVTAVTPMAGAVEAIRRNTIGFLQDYFILLDVREQNRKLKADNDKLRIENVYFRNQLATAEHARALTLFQAESPSKTVAARVIGNSTVASAKAVFIDRGSTSGIGKGMAVVTPEGVVGKVVGVYPLVSQVLLVTDPTFKVGVESQKGHVHGILNCGGGSCTIEQIQNEDKVDVGEWFFTSGEDRIFPKGFPVGTVVSAQPGQGMKDIKLNLSGTPAGVEEVLVVLRGVHQKIPAAPVADDTAATLLTPPPPDSGSPEGQTAKPQTEADKILHKYQQIGKAENHVFGAVGSNLPDFNAKPDNADGKQAAASTPAAASAGSGSAASGSGAGSTVSASAKTVPHAAMPAAPVPPTILGARPGSKPPAQSGDVAKPRPETDAGPVLPLGSPRHKPATSTQAPSTPPPSTAPRQ